MQSLQRVLRKIKYPGYERIIWAHLRERPYLILSVIHFHAIYLRDFHFLHFDSYCVI